MLRALLVYTAARVAIFAALLALLWTLGLGSFPGILFALLLSMPVAYFLLGRQRENLTRALLERRSARAALRERMRGDQPAASDRESDREQDPEH